MASPGTTPPPNREPREWLRLIKILGEHSALLIVGLLIELVNKFLTPSEPSFQMMTSVLSRLFLLAYTIKVTVHAVSLFIGEFPDEWPAPLRRYLPWALAGAWMIAPVVTDAWPQYSITVRKQDVETKEKDVKNREQVVEEREQDVKRLERPIVEHDRQFAYALVAYTVAYANAFATSLLDLPEKERTAKRRKLNKQIQDSENLLSVVKKDTPYVMGYLRYRQSQLPHGPSKPDPYFFDESIAKKEFVAQSFYMEGTIEREQQAKKKPEEGPDFTKAIELMTQAIGSDSQYAAAYYGRAIAEVKQGEAIAKVRQQEFDSAVDDLKKAVRQPIGPTVICAYLRDKDEIDKYWKVFEHNEMFEWVRGHECQQETYNANILPPDSKVRP